MVLIADYPFLTPEYFYREVDPSLTILIKVWISPFYGFVYWLERVENPVREFKKGAYGNPVQT
jgi:hypothetical protein